MNECFRCGVSEEKEELFNVVSSKGIVKICKKCNQYEGFPVLRKANEFQIKKSEKISGVYERLSKYAGVDPVEHRKKFGNFLKISTENKEDKKLREIVNKDIKTTYEKKRILRSDLVDNFHWIVMRARRARKITREQFAREINESEYSIKLIEEGIIPENNEGIIKKIEDYLGIRIRKTFNVSDVKKESFSSEHVVFNEDSTKKEAKERFLKYFDENSAKNLTISDLKKNTEEFNLSESKQNFLKDSLDPFKDDFKKDKKRDSGEELSVEEVERILYGE